MQGLKTLCNDKGFPFTADSSDAFDMGDASGHFSYIEDPDGTLIEFVETYKIPIIKKIGWYLDLKKRDPEKLLPDWMIGLLGLGLRAIDQRSGRGRTRGAGVFSQRVHRSARVRRCPDARAGLRCGPRVPPRNHSLRPPAQGPGLADAG